MKKIKITLLTFFLLPCCIFAQIPNADFELWEPASPLPSEPEEFPRHWAGPPHLGSQHYPIEKTSNLNMGQYAVLVKNTMPSPSSVGGAAGTLETTFMPSSEHFLLSMEVRYDSIVPPGKAKVEIRGPGGYLLTHWVDEAIAGEMETIQIEVVLPEAFDQMTLRIVARGVYNPNYGTPPFNGGYDGYAEIVVDNIVYENAVASQEPFEGKDVQIFPNPASETVWVKTKNGEPIRAVSVFNSTGALVLKTSPSGNEYQVDVRALPPGGYWMEIALAGRRFVRQWVKE